MKKYFPYVLIVVTVLIGGLLLFWKGLIPLPALDKKANVVNVGKTSVVEILFKGNEYKLSYASMDPGKLVDIAKFDKTEQWQGSGSIEDNEEIGEPVMALVDRDRQKTTTYLVKNYNFIDVDNIKFAVKLDSDPENAEVLNILFGDKSGTNFYRFPITNLAAGWNYYSIPKHRFFLVENEAARGTKTAVTNTATQKSALGWDKIERLQLELISRPGSKASVGVGWIRGVKEDTFDPEWNWDGKEHFLNLAHVGDGMLSLLVQNMGKGIATLKKVGGTKDFSYSSKITSLKRGNIGLFFRGDYKTGYGYYLVVGGEGTGDWSLLKFYLDDKSPKSTVLLNGQIANYEFSSNQPFWLKVTAKGNNIGAYFSLDGKDYTKLGEVNDNEFSAGGVGIAVSAGTRGYFDDFNLTQ
jgi:hypothetical protein